MADCTPNNRREFIGASEVIIELHPRGDQLIDAIRIAAGRCRTWKQLTKQIRLIIFGVSSRLVAPQETPSHIHRHHGRLLITDVLQIRQHNDRDTPIFQCNMRGPQQSDFESWRKDSVTQLIRHLEQFGVMQFPAEWWPETEPPHPGG